MTKTETQLSRRKLLGRIGVLAAASYTVPAFTTLSMAQAGSNSSNSSKSSAPSASAPSASAPSNSSPSNSGPSSSGPSSSGPSSSSTDGTAPTKLEVCGPENIGDPVYDQCIIDNGFADSI